MRARHSLILKQASNRTDGVGSLQPSERHTITKDTAGGPCSTLLRLEAWSSREDHTSIRGMAALLSVEESPSVQASDTYALA